MAGETGKQYEAVIGLEIHIEVKGAGKMFCGCPAEFSLTPNVNVCPICMGYPGALPRFNRRVLAPAVREGLMLGAEIAREVRFDRKHYFYPDLPKGYQITQAELPLASGGAIFVHGDRPAFEHGDRPVFKNEDEVAIRIRRMHMEEDAAKVNYGADGAMRIDYNRAGVPLLEIVTEPDLRSGAEAAEFAEKLRLYTVYAGVSDCRMNEGSMRIDVNVSVHRPGDPPGSRVELKNINSFAFMRAAIDFEVRRQTALLEAGEAVPQETRRFSEETGETLPMRAKENSAEYRYLPERDIVPVPVSAELIEAERKALPERPEAKLARYIESFGLRAADAELIASEPARAAYYEAVCGAAEIARRYEAEAAKFCISRVFPGKALLTTAQTAAIVRLIAEGELGSANVVKLIEAVSGRPDADPAAELAARELGLIRDEAVLAEAADNAIRDNPEAVRQYLNGKTAALQALKGACMKATRGRAEPMRLDSVLKSKLQMSNGKGQVANGKLQMAKGK
ncbi:MAG: Asp-tRNA(Asn)/Glu-tRNA(Gln) amidotransferase subunit GatB [Clostridia bacterium]|nr:Asp-tRNA(Asn)/Glu-tRNA(Gln) amidotransferase subunit GatB [Clostridia bacterium]